MTQDLVVGNLVIPGLVAALVVAAWELLSARALKGLEARLARQGEAFRLAQSPRVDAAVELWGAVCEFERAVTDLVTPYYALHLGDEAGREEHRLAHRAHRDAALEAIRLAHRRVVAARARAECLLPREVHEAVEALRRAVAEAGDQYWLALAPEGAPGEGAALRREAAASLAEAARLREPAVVALRIAIDPAAGT
jgi:hypothetical protein